MKQEAIDILRQLVREYRWLNPEAPISAMGGKMIGLIALAKRAEDFLREDK